MPYPGLNQRDTPPSVLHSSSVIAPASSTASSDFPDDGIPRLDMVFYSLGSACGAFASTLVYAHGGWTSVCLLGTGLGLAGLTLACLEKPESVL